MTYKRLLLKLSGEALAGESGGGLDPGKLSLYASIIRDLCQKGHQVAVVVGGGNFWRGRQSEDMDRMAADKIGMLATLMNSIALADALTFLGQPVRLMTALPVPTVGEAMRGDRARDHLEAGRVVILGGGTGNPFFSTDSAAALRAAEIKADLILKSTLVDGVYDKDPRVHEDALLLKEVTFSRILEDKLAIIDATAAALCRDFALKMVIFNGHDPKNILRAASGEAVGSLVQ